MVELVKHMNSDLILSANLQNPYVVRRDGVAWTRGERGRERERERGREEGREREGEGREGEGGEREILVCVSIMVVVT